MALIPALIALGLWRSGPDPNAHPTAPEDWIGGGKWASVQGERLEPVTGGSSWADVR